MGSFWKDKKVLVTGATGFLGSWLTLELANQGAEVTTIVHDIVPNSNFYIQNLHKKINLINGSLTDFHTIERAVNEYAVDTVFHLAAQSQVLVANRSPLSTFEANIKGTWNVLEATRQLGVKRIVVASSDKAYGPQKKLPYFEDTPLSGRFSYDASKACADILAQSYFVTYNLPVGITRCANLYGGGDYNYDRIIPGTVRSILRNEVPIIRSDGTPERDYMYVKDAVNGYLMLAEQLDRKEVMGEAFNMGTGKGISAKDVVATIIKMMGKKIEPKILLKEKIKGEIDRQYLASDKAHKVLGWKPKYSFENGLKETIAWYKKNLK
ncbi:MAG: GDP-mannose 4,6-dehydratase [Candidatus Woesearchaeota archaeon]